MKNITLIKQHPSPQLAHLYEHLFLEEVYALFYRHQLFPRLDYGASGITSRRGGVVIVDITLHTKKAIELSDTIKSLHIPMNEADDYRNISHNLMQMATELPEQLHVTNKQAVIDELTKLDRTEWKNIDDFGMLELASIRHKYAPIYLTKNYRRDPRRFSISLSLEPAFAKENPSLLPLFTRLSRIFLCEVINHMMTLTGMYDELIYVRRNPIAVILPMLILHRFEQKLDPHEMVDLCQKISLYLFTKATISRIIDTIHSINYTNNYNNSPVPDDMIHETGVLIGSATWHSIATTENITQILSHTTVELKFGRQKVSAPLIKV